MLYSRIYLLYWNFPLNPSITRDVSSGFINPDSYKSQRLTTWACVRIWWLKHHYSTLPEAWKKSVWVDFHTNWCLEEILRFLDYIAKNGTTKFLPMLALKFIFFLADPFEAIMDVGLFPCIFCPFFPSLDLRTEGAVEIHLVSYNSCISRVAKHSHWHLVLCLGCWDVVEVPVVSGFFGAMISS